MASSSQGAQPAQPAPGRQPEANWTSDADTQAAADEDFGEQAREEDRRRKALEQNLYYAVEMLKMYLSGDICEGRLSKEVGDKYSELLARLTKDCHQDAQEDAEEFKKRFHDERSKTASSSASSSAPPSQDTPQGKRRMSQPECEPDVGQTADELPEEVEEDSLPAPSGLPPQGSAGWEYPLSKAEKQHRLHHVHLMLERYSQQERRDLKKQLSESKNQKQEITKTVNPDVDLGEMASELPELRVPKPQDEANGPSPPCPSPVKTPRKKTTEENVREMEALEDEETLMDRIKGVFIDLFSKEAYYPQAAKDKARQIGDQARTVNEEKQES